MSDVDRLETAADRERPETLAWRVDERHPLAFGGVLDGGGADGSEVRS